MKGLLAIPVFLLIAWILLYGCANRQQVGKQVNRPGYSYRVEANGNYILWVHVLSTYDTAIDELCPVKQFVCAIEPTGETYDIERTVKP